ncbi:concanavalin A-like lectin/glucanase domain-containing protein [Emericellopsis atlantica]|uniref:Concanavalin A-like lectin/glucanase domain-containing protein n=1 Tax=Emericellopsis atlantica TaxID=2614577 RepID=A0A9P7ZP10_9HYPO|nr:concanavalin A-like lectin/glucanase domain-containing protein [Emericellopsis atlantica]KAG9255201.1 concanavalin A-like lectin/glucanase domain-containing protein [Emericellopsis atlantica]
MVFTDSLETDFTKIAEMGQADDWIRQEFNVAVSEGRGEYGKAFRVENVFTTTESSHDTGLTLRVGAGVVDNAISAAELDTARLDMYHGSFRAGMKIPQVKGTCAAFFWYFNDTQEIDIEFLTREFEPDKQIYPVHLVIQPKETGTGGMHQQVHLDFDPTAAFHEYRIDYLPGRVVFYADSRPLAAMEGDGVPQVGGHLILQHWSNGDPQWSGGPPEEDALLAVRYVQAYFNSSLPDGGRSKSAARRCVVQETISHV